MPELMVTGGRKLQGRIKISGAKNAVLPQMAASLLTREKVTLTNVPDITDVRDMKSTLEAYGVTVKWDKPNSTLVLQAGSPTSSLPGTNAGAEIRAAFLVFGPLLARTRRVEVYKPGGCKIGKKGRPVDYHIQAMKDMGAELIKESAEVVSMRADSGLKPATITFKNSSVGATETAIMAASLVKGETVIRNAAIEPEICDLVKMLAEMGAQITIEKDVLISEKITPFGITEKIAKWNVIRVRGCKSLEGVTHQVMPDRIEFGTYAIAAAMTNGKVEFEVPEDMKEDMLKAICQPLDAAGVKIDRYSQYGLIVISLKNGTITPVDIKTGPYPGFPTDLLPQWVAFMTQAQATMTKEYAIIHDKIYDGRFNYVDGLKKMGAVIEKVNEREYGVKAGSKLNGTRVEATDLRGGAALVLAGLVAQGSTVVRKFELIQRGYQDMVGKLNKCGANLKILKETRPGFHGGPGHF
ncbi:UDP-N-acetylglucosamine 1-carboxyvinyltransferase [Paramuricea clavata]|uniref:UDP-N-acetylglucosamine 1-carboxyvinyltransferase n=1 Tax=Paramuricea clavata TaxID=317549 RepID=A0A6S7I7V9_PARCT|nr:UDP-N-acetylglucosamine 1-carboxyvinyltransferase [Paramuricea clavata]